MTATDLSHLEARWISRDLAEAAFLRRVDSVTGGELVGRKRGDYGGIAIPYFMPGSTAFAIIGSAATSPISSGTALASSEQSRNI